jgi:hypothetical protein
MFAGCLRPELALTKRLDVDLTTSGAHPLSGTAQTYNCNATATNYRIAFSHATDQNLHGELYTHCKSEPPETKVHAEAQCGLALPRTTRAERVATNTRLKLLRMLAKASTQSWLQVNLQGTCPTFIQLAGCDKDPEVPKGPVE